MPAPPSAVPGGTAPPTGKPGRWRWPRWIAFGILIGSVALAFIAVIMVMRKAGLADRPDITAMPSFDPPVPGLATPMPVKPPPVEATPAPSALVDQELSRLERGSLAFNAPPTMVLRKTQTVQLLIQPGVEPSELAPRVTAPGPVVTDTVAVSRVMEATLAGGPAFHIDDHGAPREQAVGAREPTQWNWLVTPIEAGSHQLHLTVHALVTIGGVERRKVLATREYNIDVEIPASAPPSTSGPFWWHWGLGFLVLGGAALFGWRAWTGARGRPQSDSLPLAEGAPVFVSYSRQDSAAVADLVARLHAQGVPVWMDTRNIEGGEMWATAIATAIRQCRVVILMASPSARDSSFVRKEIALATSQAKPVVPVLVRPCELHPEWELATAGVQRIDLARAGAAQATVDILRALAHNGVHPASSPLPRLAM